MPKYEETIAGTDLKVNPELPAPKKIVGHSSTDIESGPIEAPLSGGMPLPPPSATAKITRPKIKRSLSIRESDNGFIMEVDCGQFHEQWVFTRLSKALKTIAAFFKATIEEE